MEPLVKFGSSHLSNNQCLLGKRLADELDVMVGDEIVFTQMGAYTSRMNGAQIKQMTIGGLFQSGITEYDRSMVYTSLKDAKEFLSMDGQISGISIHLNDNAIIHRVTDDLFQILGYPYFITTWKEKHSNLYEWMSVQRWPILIIFSMISLVGIINIISAISMIIIEKIKEIGLLKALGCTRKQIRTIFMVDGTIIGTIGTIIGGITAICLIWLQAEYQLISIPEDVYFMDRIPVIISWKYFSLIFFSSILISIIASVLPTSYAGKIKPAEAVRYE
jgi:lipoprotein-releasing system permease protein